MPSRKKDFVIGACILVSIFGLYMLNPWYAVVGSGLVVAMYIEESF